MIEPDKNNFLNIDFEGGKRIDAWWIRRAETGLDVWGERKSDDEVDIHYKEEKTGHNILVGIHGEKVGLNVNQMLIAVYDRWSGELTAFTAGLGMCLLDAEREVDLPPGAVDQAMGLIGQGEDILAILDMADCNLSLMRVNLVGATFLGEAALVDSDPEDTGYEFMGATNSGFEGVILELGVSRDSIDFYLHGEGEIAVRYQVARRVDLDEIRKQKHLGLAGIQKLIRSTFLTLGI